MKAQKSSYRRNLFLNILFIVLVFLSLLLGLFIAYNLTEKYVRNEFESLKVQVLDDTFKPYNEFFQKKLPEISLYQGFLDSASAASYTDTVFNKYRFIKEVIFYDIEVTNKTSPNSFQLGDLIISPKIITHFKGKSDHQIIYNRELKQVFTHRYFEEFNKISSKFSSYIQDVDTLETSPREEHAGVYYHITPNKITFMNIPREEEIKIFKKMLLGKLNRAVTFEQDIFTFILNPSNLIIKNANADLYQEISIKPILYEPVVETETFVSTEISLSGPFSEYKLFFRSSEAHLLKEVKRRFLPVILAILLVYFALAFIAYLIYRNLNINSKLFKLQYDFVNNLTHEFKTPVSVIKIAGNNIKSANQLSERERKHYGKILDEEADKLNDLMNKLLSFTQIENQSIQVKNEEVNLEIFIQNIVDAYQIKYPDFELTYELRDVKRFITDPVLLNSIFQNLIDNAYKYSMPKRKALYIDVSLERGFIVFRFADQGIGIPKEEMNNIFKKFYRIKSQYNQQGSVGLGLAFCKELVNFMQGQITVKSKEGIGSEFSVTLPYNN